MTLRGVIVGAGYFSQFHLEAWKRMDDVDLVAVCDTDQSVAQKAATEFQIATEYDDVARMLDEEQPDFIDIVTRPDSHLAIVREAVSRGIAVICQKPLAPTIAECRELVAVAQKADVPLMVHENFRFQPWYREIRKLLDQGLLGNQLHTIATVMRTGDGWQPDAYLARQPYFRTMPRFLVYETGVHFVDTFRFLGGEISGVYADLRTLNSDIAGEDTGTVLFEFASGARGCWDANRYNESLSENPRYTFGTTSVEGSSGTLWLHDDGRITVKPLGGLPRSHPYQPSKQNFAGDCVYATQSHFVERLLGKQPFETSGTDYLRTLAIQEAIYESAKTGMPVRGLGESVAGDSLEGDSPCE